MKSFFDYVFRQVMRCCLPMIVLIFTCNASAQTLANLNDRLAIAEQIARYSYAADSYDLEAFMALFAEDAVWKLIRTGQSEPAILLENRDAIRKFSEDRNRRRKLEGIRSHHHQSGLLFMELTETTARTQNMVLVTVEDRDGSEESDPRIELSGFYYDTWRKADKDWLIETRTFRNEPLPITAK